MERRYFLELGEYTCFVDAWLDGDSLRLSNIRLFDVDQITDPAEYARIRKEWTTPRIKKALREKYDLAERIFLGIWVDDTDGAMYDLLQVVHLKDGLEKYVLARDMNSWDFVLLDMDRVAR